MTFSEKVKEARAKLNLNQQQLADLIGVSKRSVAAYEVEGVTPRGTVTRNLAKTLQVSVEYLM
ncbi:MAG: helix-turn-helix transcriptional regulator, partial [Oscillospiraceae bacterium]